MSSRVSSVFTQSRPGGTQPELRNARGNGKGKAHQGATEPVIVIQPSVDELDEAALRQFDLDIRFGPLSGVSRLARWERAQKLGLAPPVAVKALILKHGEGSAFNKHLFEEGVV